MDPVSAVLLSILNVPLFLFLCRLFQRTFFRGHRDFWRSLLAWSFDPHGFFDKDSRHNHLAVLFLSVSAACCVLLVFFEYELAYRLVDSVRGFGPLQVLTRV